MKRLNDSSDITDILLNDKHRYAPLNEFADVVMCQKSQLSRVQRELIAAYVSSLNECSYCHGSHETVAVNLGVDPGLLKTLFDNIETADIDDKLKPIFKFVKKLTISPSKMIQNDADLIFSQGWSEQTLEDVICVCSLFNFYNRLMDGHGIKGNTELFKRNGVFIEKFGYRIKN